MLYITSPEHIHLVSRSLYPMTNITPFPPLLGSGNHPSTL